VSPMVKQKLIALGVTKRIEIFPNPIDTDSFRPDRELRTRGRTLLGLSDKQFVIMGSGQVQPRKGISDFIKLAQMLPEFEFVWVGGKPFKNITANDAEMDALLSNPP